MLALLISLNFLNRLYRQLLQLAIPLFLLILIMIHELYQMVLKLFRIVIEYRHHENLIERGLLELNLTGPNDDHVE